MTYLEYVALQKEKTADPARRHVWLGAEWTFKVNTFRKVFEQQGDRVASCGRALCVGARTGQEVRALLDMGIDAIGIDLVPCEPLVIEGDMHRIPFGSEAFGFIFSNAIDHALYPRRFAKEVGRVLRPGGYVLLHLVTDTALDKYGTFPIDASVEVVRVFTDFSVLVDCEMSDRRLGLNWELVLQKQLTAEVA